MTLLNWMLVAMGFTGAWTLLFLARRLHHAFRPPLSVEAFFSPKGNCTDAVVRELKATRREILVLAYSFTSRPIAEALLDAKLRGVHVEVILDHSNETEAHTELAHLLEQGLVPVIDAHHAIAHNKVMILDSRTLITGSFNFTNQAETENAENLLIIKGHAELVTRYRQNFHVHKEHARAVQNVAAKTPAAGPARKAA
jgi:phosphatidylserine/phosphatidylglycerophosphate/cardiolipin synthase-like enzyme